MRCKFANCVLTTTVVGVLVLALLPDLALARPRGVVIRHKRVSDQRLAELEALVGLSKMRGRLVTVPIGFGRVDPAKIGRKRRSLESRLLHKLRPLQLNLDKSEFADEMPIHSWLQMENEQEDERRVFN